MVSEITSGFGFWEWLMVAFAIIALLLIIPFAIFDTLRSRYLSTGQKFLWITFILIAPYLGAVVYLFWGRKQKAL
ncbi:MAG: PLDc N-terminal domain-containing protein [Pedobacter sp.]|jgi:hypothetical protein